MNKRRDQVRVVTPEDREPGPRTPGMDRQQAFATEGTWSGFVRTEAGMVSGWHHHGGCESVIYVLTGAIRVEFGPDGAEAVVAGPGDFVYVPKDVVHRESNPSAEPADIVVVRSGTGQSLFNVDGPEPG
ncbi:cupin [Streptomyces griseoruber]|uniref:Cupin n=2 Tax=Streptomyces griseoruber TaxID=1943 RepID=A0A101T3I1_9ACTN|nr:cupin [Streptomyces griseoruber]